MSLTAAVVAPASGGVSYRQAQRLKEKVSAEGLRGLSAGRGFDSHRLHHFCLSKHSLSQKTRLTERRVLACNRLIIACFGLADLRTAHPSFDPFGRPKRPFGPLFP